MDAGESSGTKEEENAQAWAKLVSVASDRPEIEIMSGDEVLSSEIASSSIEKREWCRITMNPDRLSGSIRNLSSDEIVVDGDAIGEGEAREVRCGSEIVLRNDKEGHLSYSFEVPHTEVHDNKRRKIALDVEHAKCSICLNIWHDVVTVAPCLHNFCNGCFSEWLRRSPVHAQGKKQAVICPQCRATVHSVGRNHFLHNIEEAIKQTFSSPMRSDEEIALLETYASVKTYLILGKLSKRRCLSTNDTDDMNLPCPQCGTELAGFKCTRATAHLQCQGCMGMMPSRPDTGVPQHCRGCDGAFCGAYWLAQGVDVSESSLICRPDTFKPIAERSISRIPDCTHQNNRYEKDITERCIQQTGKSLQAMISDWMIKFDNREIDRSSLLINHAETITTKTHLCNGCYDKFIDYLLYWFRVSMPKHLLPPDAFGRMNCWYGHLCRTQHHSDEHARKRNHVCRPTRNS